MAFTGTPTYTMVSDRKVLVTGLSLVGDDDVEIAGGFVLAAFVGELPADCLQLPGQFKPVPYANSIEDVFLDESIEVRVNKTGTYATSQVTIVKTGTSPQDFQVLLTIPTEGTDATLVEIWIEYH